MRMFPRWTLVLAEPKEDPQVVVKNTEFIEQAAGSWNPSDVAFIRELRFFGRRPVDDVESETSILEMVAIVQPRPPLSAGWPDPEGSFWQVLLKFTGVHELTLKHQGMGDLQVVGFCIDDHSKDGWEFTKLWVGDYELDAISFWAASAEVLSCSRLEGTPVASPLSRQYPGEFPEK